ncbi:hypothetical protein [Thalassomonas sp. M1454]|uniref:hypothetical protein n=1 Tax=Thalassomonas sp. M1454 TaxID=2594477 RepID=UPI001180BEC9|nr:hypothetical protein [Thalassomonas sp. M1454]TRX57160.1 hypothetical protein FNN08_06585 [Thalassomonas sp. M1454]
MFNTKLKKLSALMLVGASVSLTGCDLFDDDNGSSSNFASFEGDALKGALINAEVSLYHHTDVNKAIYTTSTDANGDYSFNAVLDQSGVYLIKVVADADTTMICDTDNCGTADNPIAFGETVPSELLTGVELSNVTFVEESEELTTIETQVNAVTSVATELLIVNLENSAPDLSTTSPEGFANMQEAVTVTVAAMFGVDVSEGTNVFDLQLPNLNDSAETAAADAAESGFAIINAAVTTAASDDIATSITTIVDSAATLADTNSTEAGEAWIAVQDALLDDAVMIAANENITLSPEAADAVVEIEKAANEGVDLSEIEDAVDEADKIVDSGGETGGASGGA